MAEQAMELITEWFDKMKFGYARVNDSVLHTGFLAKIPFYYYPLLIEVRVSQHWVVLRGLILRQIPKTQHEAILRFISGLNTQCYLVRYIIVDGSVVLQAEIPIGNLHSGTLLVACEAIMRYATSSLAEITLLATNPSFAVLFSEVDVETNVNVTVYQDDPADTVYNFDISANRISD